jgi:hypothetical protein
MATLHQRLDSLIINLKVISKLEGNQRLIFKNKTVSIRNYYMIYTPIIRSAAGESREDVITGLTELIEDINRLVSDFLNSSELQNHNASEYDRETALSMIIPLNRLKIELPHLYDSVDHGLNAVMKIYNDPVSPSKIEGIIDSIKSSVRQLTISLSKLNKKFDLDHHLDDQDSVKPESNVTI